MAKGRETPSELIRDRDSETGAEILQMTDGPAISHATYFLQSSFSADGEVLLFISNRNGSWQLFGVEGFPSGPIRQWTDGPAIHPFSPAFAPSGKSVYFVRGASVWSIDRATLKERQIVSFPEGSMGEPSIDPRGEWMVAAIRTAAGAGLAVGRTNGADWRILPFPRTVIHPQFHPGDPEWILFAGDPAPRMHAIRRDGTGLKCLYQHGNEEFVVHETFLGSTGEIAYTVWPHALRSMNFATGVHRTIRDCNAWHITPNHAGTQVLCDTNHPDLGLHLVNVATGKWRKICRSGASGAGSQWRTSRYALAEDFAAARSEAARGGTLSWMEAGTDTVYGPQWTHPHPSFSPDETKVVFASDRTGTTQVYVATLPF